jgi:glucosamine kinase
MILVVDSGSTKADWQVVANGQLGDLHATMGFSPFYHTSELIESTLRDSPLMQIGTDKVTNIYYYGTGVHDAYRAEIIRKGLQPIFINAQIEVVHDLLAAARATCGTREGIACILGTGSNSCYYDGVKIVDNVPSLGFLLGDEGSGAHLGRALLQSYFYRELPAELKAAFDVAYPEGGTAIKDKVYDGGTASTYIATFTHFLYEHRHNTVCRRIIQNCFEDFIRRQIAKYPKARQVPIHFVGSIAWHFQDILHDALQGFGYKMGDIVRKPILTLAAYHLQAKHSL